ncbi:ribosome biosynthesis protein [Starmerella bacillaris]|uniref:Protein MAK16 n=1 Tax=Starmerella bacillaris TaxID=1247836 RepID=A0AAV5RES0_STABA|nr:ribosome biosynthesis protein [Starmerella bacillaris]
MANCSDDVIWEVINKQFCSYKISTAKNELFCRNEYNITGICSRITCPLANSQYATVRSIDGKIVLCIKTPERQHLPSKWWQQVELSEDYDEAVKQIEENLMYWPDRILDRVKQRLTRLFQVQITQQRLALQQDERHYTVRSAKVKRREASRERKALVAAKLERAIERELLDRLKSGAYGEQPLNVDEGVWNKVLSKIKGENQADTEVDAEVEQELEEGEVQFVEDDEEDDDLVDVEDMEQWLDRSDSGSDSGSDSESGSDSDNSDTKKKSKKPIPRKRVKAPKAPKPKRKQTVEYEMEEERGAVRAQLN